MKSMPVQVDGASFLNGAHYYKHAQHSQAEVQAETKKVTKCHKCIELCSRSDFQGRRVEMV